MTRTPMTCPRCGGPARAASYRAERQPGAKGTPYIPIGRAYCPRCDRLLPRDDDGDAPTP